MGIALPKSVKVINLTASADEVRVVLQAKLEITKEDFDKLASALKMKKEAGATVPKGYLFRDSLPGAWWDPPEATDQMKLEDSYVGKIPYPNRTDYGDIAMIWVKGVAYIYKFAP